MHKMTHPTEKATGSAGALPVKRRAPQQQPRVAAEVAAAAAAAAELMLPFLHTLTHTALRRGRGNS